MTEAHVPYGAYWSTPFARWQGSLSHLSSVEFGAHVAKQELAARGIAPSEFDFGVLGMTIPQPHCFYGLPWVTGMIGATGVGGPTIMQACATGARVLSAAAEGLQSGAAKCVLTVTTDRTSNGPHLYYPAPGGIGGTGESENWTLDNMARDPYGGTDMTTTAENCASRWQITTDEQHDVVLRRYSQYQDAVANDHAFHKRYMTLPFAVPDARYRKTMKTLDGDEGIHPTTAEGLAKLKPVKEGGTVTYGGQTHPADGCAGMVVTDKENARRLSRDPNIEISVRGFGLARTEKSLMPAATVPAARRALAAAGIDIDQVKAVKSHNPFAVNDIVFARETGFDVMRMNNYGCSLIWGHPQGPTGTRAIIELIEELALAGGGWGLFQGCAAGDTAMAVVVKVDDRR